MGFMALWMEVIVSLSHYVEQSKSFYSLLSIQKVKGHWDWSISKMQIIKTELSSHFSDTGQVTMGPEVLLKMYTQDLQPSLTSIQTCETVKLGWKSTHLL